MKERDMARERKCGTPAKQDKHCNQNYCIGDATIYKKVWIWIDTHTMISNKLRYKTNLCNL